MVDGSAALATPVALSVFNRPDTTARVLRAIAGARPQQLFVFADGPRSSDEAKLCARAREVIDHVDWECDVRREYSSQNLGAKVRYSSGVDWVFSEVPEAIVLDDDCVPDPTFFRFCEETLRRYRDDPRVMMVCGSNYLEHWNEDLESYHFSRFGSVWGWASWRRAWRTYDVTMAAWDSDDVKSSVRALIADDETFEFQARRFDRIRSDPDEQHSWDVPWMLTRLVHDGLTVVPAVNLVANHGNSDGRGLPPGHPLATLRVAPLTFPLRPPPRVEADREYDRLHVRCISEWWNPPGPAGTASGTRSRRLHRRVTGRLRTLSRQIARPRATRNMDGRS
jgi:hypothetical protein